MQRREQNSIRAAGKYTPRRRVDVHPSEIAVRFFSIAEHTIRDTHVMLEHKVGTMALIPFIDEGFTVRHGENPGLRLTYFETVVTAKKDRTVVGAVILPVTSESEAREVTQSLKHETDVAGSLAVSFVQAGKRHHYTYDRRPDGLLFTGKRRGGTTDIYGRILVEL